MKSQCSTTTATYGYVVLAELFTGKERDAESGLDYFGARYMSSAQGRFTSPDIPLLGPDPKDPQSWNLYSYALNNPLRFSDPTGHTPEDTNETGCGVNLKDCGPTIGPLPKTPGTQVGERVMGAIKGTLADALNLGDSLVGGNRNTVAARLADRLAPNTQDEKFGANVAGILVMLTGGGEGRAIKIIEESAGAIHLEVKTAQGAYEVMANVQRTGSKIVLDGAHIEGAGAGQFGPGLLRELREAARQFGKEQGVSEVVVNPGVRTSGANPGRAMRPFTVEVK